MTDILCRWLNDELHLSVKINQESFAQEFSSGYLIGEVLHKYQLQNDFDQFSQSKTADSKLNNFTRLEPVFLLLGIPFDITLARNIMTEKHGAATQLLYQMYISLNNKKKANLTGVAMETMLPAAPAKLGVIESNMYKEKKKDDERLKQATPRQTDLDLQALVLRFHENQIKLEQSAFREKFEEAERLYKKHQEEREALLARNRALKEKQSEMVAKINAATIYIPKPPPKHTMKSSGSHSDVKKREAEESIKSINAFEEKMRNLPKDEKANDSEKKNTLNWDVTNSVKQTRSATAPKDDYIGKIRKRLHEDSTAREEREKRRRKVLRDQMIAHETQEEARREEMMVNRLMRQSQQERRIAVQLLQARHEKEIIRQNRLLMEKQYQERRQKDFEEALDREAQMAELHRLEYAEQIKADQQVHNMIAAQRAEERYTRHYNVCEEIVSDIVDFAYKVADYRELTSKLLPPKLMRDWKLLFTSGKPLFDKESSKTDQITPEQLLEEERQRLLDEGDFMEYKYMTGEWEPPAVSDIKGPPEENPVVGHIVHRLFAMVHPPTPPLVPPEFPPFPIRACVLGKVFSGKSTVIKRLAEEHRLQVIVPEQLIQEALEAYKAGEVETVDKTTQINFETTLSHSGEEIDQGVSTLNAADLADALEQHLQTTENSSIPTASHDTPKSVDNMKNSPHVLIHKEVVQIGPEPTARAKLGEKAMKFLKKGKPVEDQVVIDIVIEAIRKIPAGTGWVLDGYPHTYAQAKLLEKALSGIDTAKTDSKTRISKSSLVNDPRPAPPPPDPPSGIDVVVLFDIRDELCLKRAAGRTEQVQAGKSYHEEFEPPPEGSATGVGKVEKVQPVVDPSFDQEQIQTRITGFVDHWPKLEKWFVKFGTLKTVDASLEKESLYLETEKIFEDIICRIENRGKEPEVEKISEDKAISDAPPGAPPSAALNAAPSSVQQPQGEPAPGGPELHPSSRPTSRSASRPLSKTSSHADTRGTSTAEKTAAESSLNEEKKTSLESKKEDEVEKKLSEPKLGDVEFDVILKLDMPVPAKIAGSAKKEKDKKPGSPKNKKAEGSSKGKGSRGNSPKTSKKSKTPEPEPAPEIPEGPPPIKPGDEQWNFVDLPIDFELAKVLAAHWEELEKAYVNNTKEVFHKNRLERENIYRYFYQIKKNYMEYLQRPDCKQEYVEQWQQTYNSVPDDMRDDEETKAELHQQVDNLREKLWNICDDRKEQAEKEREAIINDGWLDDRIGLLSNNYLTLMQAEVDRLQDTVRLLKDYYTGMDGQVPDVLNPDYHRVPLLQLSFEATASSESLIAEPVEQLEAAEETSNRSSFRAKSPKDKDEGPPRSPKSPKGSRSSRTLSGKKKPGDKETLLPELPKSSDGIGRKIIIPLVSRRMTNPDVDPKVSSTPIKDKKDKKGPKKSTEDVFVGIDETAVPADGDEKMIFNGYMYALQGIINLVATEIQIVEEEAEKQRELEKNKEKEKASKNVKVGKKGGKDRTPSPKKGKKEPEVAATPPPGPTMSEEELEKKLIKDREREEYIFALKAEEQAAKSRLELIKVLACGIIRDLKCKADDVFKDMNDWLGARFLKEMESIDQMSEVMRNVIENKEKIKYEIVINQDHFMLDEELKVLKTPSPPPVEPHEERPMPDLFTIQQLTTLYEHFQTIAPSGTISTKAFTEMFEMLVSVAHGTESLPDSWMHLTSSQITDLAQALSSDTDYVDWRRLLVTLCYPIPIPSQQELLDCLKTFKAMDQKSTGKVTREQWHRMQLWFKKPDFVESFDRVTELHNLLFEMFADHTGSLSLLDYMSFLMYFSACPNYHEGFLHALSLACGHHMPRLGKPLVMPSERAPSAMESIHDGGDYKDDDKCHLDTEPLMSSEPIPQSAVDALVPVEALYQVLHHGEITRGDSYRFTSSADPEDHTSLEKLSAVYQELNDDDSTSPIPYRILIEHPLIQDVIMACNRFKALDIRTMVPGASVDTDNSSMKTID
ncbi:sperm flagellar protein 2-like isoform X3 [Physella acuta]|uniref:sperm flagellar protein 2-like isoform X3 n=1 Tax=Physella acuta TaxID=109671 RepID=UPI0027DE522D|nr:sperm flagellar protein 2-like isoform X3 [Physella acuta]